MNQKLFPYFCDLLLQADFIYKLSFNGLDDVNDDII